MKRVLAFLPLLTLFALTGCFNEPEPAYKTVPPENRVYLSDKGLKDLALADAAVKAGLKLPNALTDIDYLNLDRNQLTNVAEVAGLTGLKWLRLNDNRLSTLPDMKALESLRRIYLRNNRFNAVPETLRDLPALTDVEFSGNPIRDIPAWLVAKPGLKNVSFNRTQIKSLPADLSGWANLQSLQLGDLDLSSAEMARIRKALPRVAITF